MRNDAEIISHPEMCTREGIMLQRGMYFQEHALHSVLLMSVRTNAPYADEVREDGSLLVYEGHDVPTSPFHPYPKQVDQPQFLPSGRPTENGKFYQAALDYKSGKCVARLVRVYEKIKTGIWSYNGMFELVDARITKSNNRNVFKFDLVAVPENSVAEPITKRPAREHRLIPTGVKREVWKRDRGQCRICGSSSNLHFDHIIPFSRGGSSTTSENVQILCGRHNLEKHDQIV